MDYSHEVKLINSRIVRNLLVFTGFLSFIIGAIGIFLPLLPTTPFMLLATACYAKSSARFYNCLMNNPYLGNSIQTWRHERKIAKKAKIIAIIMIVMTLGSSILFFVPFIIIKVFLAIVGIFIIRFIYKIPSK